MPRIKFSVLVLLLLLFFTGETQAWDYIVCGPRSSAFSPYWSSDTVFTGQVESVETSEQDMVAKFTVEKVYRGAPGDRVEIRTEVRHGYPFQKGERYFVYSGTKGKDGRLYVDMCSPTKGLAGAGEDIEFAGEVAAGNRGTRIHGWVFEYRPKLWTRTNNEPVAGIKVTIKGQDGREFTTVTDEKGRYVFKEPADGAYEVRAETPAGTHEVKRLKLFSQDDRVHIGMSPPDNIYTRTPFYRHWDSKNFMFTSAGSIEVRIRGVNGRPVSWQSIQLLTFDDKGKAHPGHQYPDLLVRGKRGEFIFGLVAPGKYLVAINPNGCHTPEAIQLGRMFYPGVASEENARIVTVRENEAVRLKEFKLLPPLKERWFSGTVLLPDGTPAANATVVRWQKGVTTIPTCVGTQTEVQTDAAGRFRVKGYEPYEYFIRAYIETGSEIPRKRLISSLTEIPPGSQAEEIRFILSPEN